MDNSISKKITVYNKDARLNDSIIKAFRTMFNDIQSYRWLIWRFFKRDLVAPYKQSFLGIIWAFTLPVIPISVYIGLVFMGVLRSSAGMPYLVFIFTGMTLWMFMQGAMTSVMNSIQRERNVIVKIKFPLVVIILSGYGKICSDTLLRLVLVILAFIFYAIIPKWTIMFLPVVVLPLILLSVGLGIIIGLSDVVIKDVRNIVDIFLRYGIFLSSVIFTMPTSGTIGQINRFNIFNQFIVGIREFLIYGYISDIPGYLVSSLVSVVVFVFAVKALYALEYKIVGYL